MNQINEANYEYLTNQVFPRLGFSSVVDDMLRNKMAKGSDQINVTIHGDFGKDKMTYDFQLDRKEDRYYLNAISTTLQSESQAPKLNTFKLYNQQGYNAEEMLEMMKDHFVYREFTNNSGEKIGRWATVNTVKVDDNGNSVGMLRTYYDNNTRYNLVVELGKLPLVSMSQTDKEKLVAEMKAGIPSYAFLKMPDGSKERVSLLAQPNIGGIGIYNKEGQKIRLDDNKFSVADENKFTVKEDEKKNITHSTLTMLNEGAEKNESKQGQGKGRKVS